jgi:hypothetical protein
MVALSKEKKKNRENVKPTSASTNVVRLKKHVESFLLKRLLDLTIKHLR